MQLETFSQSCSELERGDALTRWVKPVVVFELAFLELTEGLRLRHASFRALRLSVAETFAGTYASSETKTAGHVVPRRQNSCCVSDVLPTAWRVDFTIHPAARRAARDYRWTTTRPSFSTP